MADYKNKHRSGGSRPFTKNSFASKELFTAECNSCHDRCQVPFRPNGKKPVYCSNCFTKNDAKNTYTSSYHSDSRARPERSAPGVSDREIQDLKREIQAMKATLQELVTTVDTFNRASALSLEIQKHFPAAKAPAAKKVVAKKKVAPAPKPAPKKVVKK